MYIAFKWLVSMALTMWISLCFLEMYKISLNKQSTDAKYEMQNNLLSKFINTSNTNEQNVLIESKKRRAYSHYCYKHPLLKYSTFIAGVSLVFIMNKKNKLIRYTKTKIIRLQQNELNLLWLSVFLKKTATVINVAITKSMEFTTYILNNLKSSKVVRKHPNINLLLLNKLKEYGQERRNIGELLIAAIQENKNIRMRYQLETMAKERLAKYIEHTQKVMKENRSRYVSFQQLYLITHQENVFLKSRMKKIVQEKEDTERRLVKLVNEICRSKNNELKAFCSRFIVKTKNNLLNSDVRSEIKQFLNNRSEKQLLLSKQINRSPLNLPSNKHIQILDVMQDELNILVKNGPKLRGLPGECIWTVKDKDGFIEKLYEYETDFDNGDTIRRIRQYSVYCDKDCLLDNTSSMPLIHQSAKTDFQSWRFHHMDTKRITGSQAFQKFLRNSKQVLEHSTILTIDN